MAWKHAVSPVLQGKIWTSLLNVRAMNCAFYSKQSHFYGLLIDRFAQVF